MRVLGEATISIPPDVAEIDLSVITQAPESVAAAEQNTAQSNRLVQQLRGLLPSADIKTVNFSVNPNYRYPKDGGAPTILGYTANNTVRLELADLSLIRKVIDLAIKSGANNVNRLNFGVRDEKGARARALAEAADQARTGAEALAASLKMRLGRLLRVEEVQPVIVSPAREIDLSVAKGESEINAPIAPGNIQIHASVNLTFMLIDK
jgi:uncharacterized protein YggE